MHFEWFVSLRYLKAKRKQNFISLISIISVAGVAIGGLGSLSPGRDVEAVILAFSLVTSGGLGSVKGAVVGALIVGLVQCLGLLVLPQLNIAFIYLVMAIILVIRPWGLFGRATA